jgi:multidrug efflux pump
VRGVTTATVASMPPATPPLSSNAASAANSSAVVTNNVVAQTNNVVSLAPASSSASAASSASASSAVRTAAQAKIASTGNSSASIGAAVATSAETMTPLSAFAHYAPANTPLAVNHQSQFVAATISFNLADGKSLSDASAAIQKAVRDIHMPGDLTGGFAGTALVYEQSLGNEVYLVLAALATIYIVLGILYESFVHPVTILSTLPSAGVGAVLALMMFDIQFTIIALIGVILLIGIVKKNAILMIDFALQAEREERMDSREAIFHAAVMRFRPIMMTTAAAMLGALPL